MENKLFTIRKQTVYHTQTDDIPTLRISSMCLYLQRYFHPEKFK